MDESTSTSPEPTPDTDGMPYLSLMSALPTGDMIALAMALPADERSTVDATPAGGGDSVVFVRVGTVEIRAFPDGTLYAHGHDSVELAQACHARDVTTAELIVSAESGNPMAQAELASLTRGGPGSGFMVI